MIRSVLFGLMLSAVVVSPAYAQGKKVVTINPDGSVTITDPEGGAAQTLPSPRAQPRRQAPFMDALPPEQRRAVMQERSAAPAPEAAPDDAAPQPVPVDKEKKTEKPVKPKPPQKKAPPAKPKSKPAAAIEKPVTEKPVTEKPLRQKILTPEMPQVPAPDRPLVEEPTLDDSSATMPVREEPEGIVRGEPAAPQSLGRVDPKVKPAPIKVRGPITPDDAKRIALDIGPPARAVEAYPADYMGRKVFQVIFYTEQGERYVLVDRKTGEIVND